MNLPNGLTVTRIAVTPVVAALPFVDTQTARLGAFALFLAAAITDWLDGYFARARGEHTDLGRVLDPLADKVLIVGMFVPMYYLSKQHPFITPIGAYDLPWWIVAVVLAREGIMTWFRQYAARRGVVIAAIWPAKVKTFVQLIWAGASYFWFYLMTLMSDHGWTGPISRTIGRTAGSIGALTMFVAFVLTLYSLFIYFRDYGHLLRTPAIAP